MKIFVNTLKGKMNFEIEVKPADTVSDVKKAIETVLGPLYPAAQQKLIYQGKVLKDETTLEENNVVEYSCIVSKAKVSSSGASTASSPSVTQAQPTQTVATPQVSAPTVSVPEPTSGTATAAAPAAPPASTQTLFAGTTLGSTTVQQILDMGGGSWDRDTVVRALRAAFNNPERAVEYLYSGIPAQAEIPPVSQAPSTGEQAANPQAQPQQGAPAAATGGPNTNPLNLFPQAQPAQTVATPAGADESEDSDGSEDVFYDAVEHQPVPPLPIHQYRHQYSQDGFQLHGLPDPVVGEVVAVVGEKRIGKTTALRVMAGKLQPNLCRPQNPPTWEETWEEIINRFTRPETRRYLERIRDEDLSVSMMEQEAGTDRELRDRTIRKVISSNNLGEPYRLWEILEKLDLDHSLLSYKPEHLTDGQFQRFSIAKTVLKHADSYVFDEPFSFLNLRQKAQAAKVIKSVLRRNPKSYVFLAENEPDLLAYMDAYACHITGIPQKRGEVVGRPEKITSEMEKN